jgi:hypothetical protein
MGLSEKEFAEKYGKKPETKSEEPTVPDLGMTPEEKPEEKKEGN